ncbi:UvrD-helicase domain-containing protein [Actinomarinicola tropica]|uniref:UvrD-helicase domain-containing protein n=1 Tax=Actinomarinicola tropica TaxID=2789776 RepID=UPI001897D725|nr:UvrD-helicase domain-containing protein [Actinomarinicola tropica]
MTTPALPDHAARHDIAHAHDLTLFVEAGAGTGKTHSLVERVVTLIRDGVPIEDLAVITFTEAAAAELRDRVRGALDTVDAGEAESRALAGLDGAAISTLHGFAQRILAENPLEAGLPPIIEVHSEIGAQVEFERRWRAFLDQLLDDPDRAEVVQRAVVLGIEPAHLKVLARTLEDSWDRLPSRAPDRPPLGPIDLEPVVAPLRAAVARRAECLDDSDAVARLLDERAVWLGQAAAATTAVERLQILEPICSGKYGRRGAKPNWPAGTLEELRSLLTDATDAAQAARAHAVDDVLRRLLDDLGRFTLAGVEERRTAGRLHFHDLLVMTRQLLRSSAAVRRRLHDRYRHLLVDEFQDTDPIQIEIARLIAATDLDVDAPWEDIATPPGRIFFVGDPKQSIYRFRRADIRLYLRVRDGDDTDERVLSTSFRSVPGIVEWVNRAFAEIMGAGTAGAQPAYNPLTPARPHGPGDLPVVAIGGPIEGSASERRATASDDLARALHRAMDDAWQVEDDRTGQWRSPRWSDIAVLVPTRTGLPELRAAFDRVGVPYRIEASSLVWLTQEVRDLLSVLRAIDDPTDQLALVAALRSPAFGCGDDDLARYAVGGGRLDLRADPPEGTPDDDPVVAGLAALRELHDAATWDEPSALVERVVRERHLMELATATPRPRDVWRRLRFVADQARAYADAEGGTLRDFLEWTDLQADESARVSETILPETDDDAVRVLTIHASKGLEFPIVAVAGIDRDPGEMRYGPNVQWTDDHVPEASVRSGLTTTGHAELWEREKEHEVHESWRLMYVATTRARDHLLLCVHHDASRGPERNVAARLHAICTAHPDTWRPLPSEEATAAPASDTELGQLTLDLEPGQLTLDLEAAPPAADPDARHQDRARWIADRAARLAEAARPSVVAATAVAGLLPAADPASPPPGDDGDGAPVDEAEPWRRGRAGTTIGRAVHATLQTVDLASGADLPAIAAAQAAAEGIPGRAPEVERLARAALGAPSIVAAARRPHWRELYLGAEVEGVLCEGYIDLLVEGDHGLEVIDHKTDRTPDPQALIPRYRLQTATYALMVEATLGRPVARCLLVVLGPEGATEVEIPDLAAATDEVRQRLRVGARPRGSVGDAVPG